MSECLSWVWGFLQQQIKSSSSSSVVKHHHHLRGGVEEEEEEDKEMIVTTRRKNSVDRDRPIPMSSGMASPEIWGQDDDEDDVKSESLVFDKKIESLPVLVDSSTVPKIDPPPKTYRKIDDAVSLGMGMSLANTRHNALSTNATSPILIESQVQEDVDFAEMLLQDNSKNNNRFSVEFPKQDSLEESGWGHESLL